MPSGGGALGGSVGGGGCAWADRMMIVHDLQLLLWTPWPQLM